MTTHCEACGDRLDELERAFGRMHERCVERLLGTMRTYRQKVYTDGPPVRLLLWPQGTSTLNR